MTPQPHSITGRVRLTAYLVDADGQFTGGREVDDADGVPVELMHGSTIVGATTTVDGAYSFSGLRAGDYVARSRVIGTVSDETLPMVIAATDVVAGDTLRLVSFGEIYPVPNPFTESARFYFHTTDSMFVDLAIHDAGGHVVRSLVARDLPAGGHIIFWDGRDELGQTPGGPLFWITLQAGADERAHLLIREATTSKMRTVKRVAGRAALRSMSAASRSQRTRLGG